jgi:hypothetical protein
MLDDEGIQYRWENLRSQDLVDAAHREQRIVVEQMLRRQGQGERYLTIKSTWGYVVDVESRVVLDKFYVPGRAQAASYVL